MSLVRKRNRGVAAKLIENQSFTPILISGRMRPNSNVLIALDGSEGSLRAADFAGRMLAGHSVNIGLIHVLRSGKGDSFKHMQLFTPNGFVGRAESDADKMLNKVRDRLAAFDFMPDQIKIHKSIRAYSRGAAIVDQAKQGNYHLVVLGRRGLSKPKKFSMGTVPSKVIHLAKESSVLLIP